MLLKEKPSFTNYKSFLDESYVIYKRNLVLILFMIPTALNSQA